MSGLSPAPSARVTVLGSTGSGKTFYIVRRWWPQARRLLVLDHIGEWSAHTNAIGYDGVLAAMREHAHLREWRIFATVTIPEIHALAEKLLPYPELSRSPALLLGGLTLSIDEVDRVIGFGAGSDLRDLWRRGRHVGLSVLAASQRPSNVSKEVTSQSSLIALLRIHEPADVDYTRALMGREKTDRALAWLSGAPHRVALYAPPTGALTLTDPIRGT